jgi:hypothetical protein
MEEQSSVLAAESKRYAITYDCIQDVLRFKTENIEPEKNTSFSPWTVSQNTPFSRRQQFWARNSPMLVEAVTESLPTAPAEEIRQLGSSSQALLPRPSPL